MDMPFLISALVFVLSLTLLVALSSYLHILQFRRFWLERVEGTRRPGLFAQVRQAEQSFRSVLVRVMEQFGSVASRDVTETNKLRQSLVTAGYRSSRAAFIFAGTRLLLAVFLPLVFLVFRPAWFPELGSAVSIGLYVLLALLGYYLPHFWLSARIKGRQRRITEGFPDALDLITICIESGLGLGPAIQRVGQELQLAHKELSEEFHLLSAELRTGLTRQQALRNLANRTALDDVKTFVGVLIQTDRFGTSVGDALRIHSDFMRKTRQFRAEEMAAKLPVKMIFPLIFFIFPSFFVVILGPAVIRIMRFMWPVFAR